MANTLFDAMQAAQVQDPSQIATASSTGQQTAQAQRLLRAKTGKAVGPGSSPQLDNTAEQAADYQTGIGAQQLRQQGALQAAGQQQQMAGLQQGAAIGQQQFQQARQSGNLQLQLQTNQMLGDLERQGKSLDQQKSQAQMEQIGTGIALQNKQYTDQLQNEGARSRLDNAAQFQVAQQQAVFGDSYAFLQQQLGQQNLLSADKRAFQDKMDRMSIGDSIQMLKLGSQQQQASGYASGVAGIGKAGVQAYGAYQDNKAKSTAASPQPMFTGTDASGAGGSSAEGVA